MQQSTLCRHCLVKLTGWLAACLAGEPILASAPPLLLGPPPARVSMTAPAAPATPCVTAEATPVTCCTTWQPGMGVSERADVGKQGKSTLHMHMRTTAHSRAERCRSLCGASRLHRCSSAGRQAGRQVGRSADESPRCHMKPHHPSPGACRAIRRRDYNATAGTAQRSMAHLEGPKAEGEVSSYSWESARRNS